MALFALTAELELTHIPYRGSAPALTDLLGKRVAAAVLPVHTALPHAREGRIRLLAVGGEARSPAMPEVPTLSSRRASKRGFRGCR